MNLFFFNSYSFLTWFILFLLVNSYSTTFVFIGENIIMLLSTFNKFKEKSWIPTKTIINRVHCWFSFVANLFYNTCSLCLAPNTCQSDICFLMVLSNQVHIHWLYLGSIPISLNQNILLLAWAKSRPPQVLWFIL